MRKELPRTDIEGQILEDVVVLVFLESYLEEFVSTHSEYDASKFEDILNKSLMKMSAEARLAIPALIRLPADLAAILNSLIGQRLH